MKISDEKKKYLLILKILATAIEITEMGGGDIPVTLESGAAVVKNPQRQYNKKYKDGSGAAIMPVIPKD